jgi:hypothetical protein
VPKQTVHEQPHSTQQLIASHIDLIILQQALSPEQQEMQQPSLVISQRQWQQVKLHSYIVMPFQQQTTEQVSPASMRHRFWSVPQVTSSSQQQ